MARYIPLITRGDDYDRAPGLWIKRLPFFDGAMCERTDGLMIAHDVTEHLGPLRDFGTVRDELAACGAIWQVRGRHGDLLTKGSAWYTPEQNIASDIVRMFEQWGAEATGPRVTVTPPTDYEDDFTNILMHAREGIFKEHTDPRPCEGAVDDYLAAARYRMRTGLRWAARKYGEGYGGANLFQAVRDAVARATKEVQFEGQEFILAIEQTHSERYTARVYERGTQDY